MKKSTLFKLSAIALSLCTSITYANNTQEFSKVVIFGDSLSDTGRLKDIVIQVAPSVGGALQASFTTNPDDVWASILADSYGKTTKPFTTNNQNGTNFAVGGARSGEVVNWNGIRVPNTSEQIETYLNKHNQKADPNALYAVWIGSNDLIAVSQSIQSVTPTPEDLQKALLSIQNTAKKTAQDINKLHQMGATTILVPNIPDLSLTPRAIKAGNNIQALAQLAATTYNRELYFKLNQSTTNVIPANTFALLQEAVANKTGFGFTHTDSVACKMPPRTTEADDVASTSLACTKDHLEKASDNDTYAFADDIHPSGRTHRILAQYYQSIIDSPKEMGKLSQQLINTATTNDQHLYRQFDHLGNHRNIWATIHTHAGKPSTQVGLNFAGDDSHTGAYLSHQTQHHTLSPTLNADTTGVGMGIYHRHEFGKIHLNAIMGLERLNVETHRNIAWEGEARSHNGDTTARRFYGGIQAGYGIDAGKLHIRPTLGIHAQKLDVRAFQESNPTFSTAMQFGKQNQNSLHGMVGVDVRYPITDKLTVLGGVNHHHEFKDSNQTINASLTSIREYTKGFDTNIQGDKQHTTTAHVGVQTALGKANLHSTIHATHQNSDTDVGGSLGVRFDF